MSSDIQSANQVEVRYNGSWWPGCVEAWRVKDGRWQVYVRFTVGMSHSGWVDADDVRTGRVEFRVAGLPSQRAAAALAASGQLAPAPSPRLDEPAEPRRRRRLGVRALAATTTVVTVLALLGTGAAWWWSRENGPIVNTADSAPVAEPASGAGQDSRTEQDSVSEPAHGGHHHPATATEGGASPAAPERVSQTQDVEAAIADCTRRWQRQTQLSGAADASLQQWRLHIVAMNKLVNGEITPARATAYWNRTRRGAVHRIEYFQRHHAGFRDTAASCVAPRDTSPGRTAEDVGMQQCVQATRAGDRVLDVASGAIASWEHHVHDMAMTTSGQITPSQAMRRWLALWRTGNRQLARYDDVARAARHQRCA
jgi:hypothetical protein